MHTYMNSTCNKLSLKANYCHGPEQFDLSGLECTTNWLVHRRKSFGTKQFSVRSSICENDKELNRSKL